MNDAQLTNVLRGGGQMGALMRAVDWSKTPVGSVETWPPSLKTVLSILLESTFGKLIAWGPDFTMFYNDAYRPILGTTKHPAQGKRVPDVFPEIWQTIGPLFHGVMQGKTVGFDDLLLTLDRHGFLEECYFTFAYTPIRDEAGAVGGVLVTVSETTMRLVQERRLRTLHDLALRVGACERRVAGVARQRRDAVGERRGRAVRPPLHARRRWATRHAGRLDRGRTTVPRLPPDRAGLREL